MIRSDQYPGKPAPNVAVVQVSPHRRGVVCRPWARMSDQDEPGARENPATRRPTGRRSRGRLRANVTVLLALCVIGVGYAALAPTPQRANAAPDDAARLARGAQ